MGPTCTKSRVDSNGSHLSIHCSRSSLISTHLTKCAFVCSSSVAIVHTTTCPATVKQGLWHHVFVVILRQYFTLSLVISGFRQLNKDRRRPQFSLTHTKHIHPHPHPHPRSMSRQWSPQFLVAVMSPTVPRSRAPMPQSGLMEPELNADGTTHVHRLKDINGRDARINNAFILMCLRITWRRRFMTGNEGAVAVPLQQLVARTRL